MKRVMVAILALMVPCAALAQEPKPQQQKKAAEPPAESQEAVMPQLDAVDEEPVVERKHIQVLNDPHEISSFYRSSQSSHYSYYEPGYNAPLVYERRESGFNYNRGVHVSPYDLSSYYRSDPAAHPATIVMPRGGSCGR